MPKSNKLAETVMDLAPAEAQAAFRVMKLIILLTSGYSDRDPIEYAFQLLREELAKLEAEMRELQQRINVLTERLGTLENKLRIQRLFNYTKQLKAIAFELAEGAPSAGRTLAIAHEAGGLCDVFLEDPDVWFWTDIQATEQRDPYGIELPPLVTALPPDFKAMPALPVYSLAVATWLTAVEAATGGSYQFVQSRFGESSVGTWTN